MIPLEEGMICWEEEKLLLKKYKREKNLELKSALCKAQLQIEN